MKIKIIKQVTVGNPETCEKLLFANKAYKNFEKRINEFIDKIEIEKDLEVFNIDFTFNKYEMFGVIYYGQPEEKY
ncbi:TPA: hypothetical protein ACQQBA_001917 [Streptococcus mutans]|uniref:hypothetical protein n=1 Tax=Streptococcus mutans TaxID=1309 RepID=UPI0002B5A55A|nr:hypothetical protein [Streptococcus mutans]EMC10056.1 hypothetical protein SMU72_00395 [Streptococcus mutans NLML9]